MFICHISNGYLAVIESGKTALNLSSIQWLSGFW